MKCPAGWGPALWLVLLGQFFRLGGAVNSHRKQPTIGAVGKLRAVIESRTEELTEQKNIAHGLELTVRELQAELLNEKKALATETQKEHTLQQKLNRVRAVLDDGRAKKEEKGSPVLPALPAAAAVSAVSEAPASVDAFHVKTLPVLPPLPPLEEAVESFPNVADAGIEIAVEPAPAQVAHSHQTTAQEPPPFFEALPAVQSSTITLPAKQAVKAPKVQARSFASGAHKAAPVQQKPRVAKMRSPPKVHSQPTKAKHMRGPAEHDLAVAKPMAVAPNADTGFDALEAQLHDEDRRIQDLDSENALDAMSEVKAPKIQARSLASGAHRAAPVQNKPKVAQVRSPPKSKPTKAKQMRGLAKHVLAVAKPMVVASGAAIPHAANVAANANSAADTGFDALEAQLHEEDRRIQDLDSENALDAMSDGGAPGSTPKAPVKPMPAQQRMDLDAEAPMEDFLNVDAQGPDSGSEVAPLASSDTALALPQLGETMGNGLDAALSDNQFLAQIAH